MSAEPSTAEPTASSEAVECSGEPLKIMTIAPLSETGGDYQPESGIGLEAAVAAANETCEAGQPLEAIACDDEFNPTAATACGRQAVEEGVVAVVGSISAFGDGYIPVLEEAGIPMVGNVSLSAADSTSAISYPSLVGLSHVLGGYSMLKSLGATKVAIVHNDLPAVQFIVQLATQRLESFGIEAVPIPVPPTETDFTQYAAQVLSSGADAASTILQGPSVLALVRALQDQGGSLEDLTMVTSETAITPRVVREADGALDCLYGISITWPVLDRSNEGIDQYLNELSAAGFSDEDASESGAIAWSMAHVAAELIAAAPTKDAAGVTAALQAYGPVDRPEIAPIDWATPAYPDDPVLSGFRIFTRQLALSRVVDGQYVPVTTGFVDEETPVDLTPVDC